jgi:hypothetical protein
LAQVGDDLMAVKIKVYPFRATAALGTAQNIAIKGAGFIKVSNWKGEVKRLHAKSPGKSLC